jgi:hypothetical protein
MRALLEFLPLPLGSLLFVPRRSDFDRLTPQIHRWALR